MALNQDKWNVWTIDHDTFIPDPFFLFVCFKRDFAIEKKATNTGTVKDILLQEELKMKWNYLYI